MIGLIGLILFIVLGAALTSMVEAAILSLPLIRARALAQEKHRNGKDLLAIKEDIHYTIAAIVIINNSISIIGSMFVGERVAFLFGDDGLGLFAALLTFLVIIFGEIFPKTIGERFKVFISLAAAPMLRFLVMISKPFIRIIFHLEKPLAKHLQSSAPKVTESEIKLMLQLGRDTGSVELDEEALCNRVFRLNDIQAAQIMKPLDQTYVLPADHTLEELKDKIINATYSRIGVYDRDPLDIVGTVEQRILLAEIAKDNYHARVRDFMVKPIFVNWATKADALLESFQSHHQHMFVVQNAQGKDVGIITMEDVLEELFGEIYDEKDAKVLRERKENK